MLVVNFNNDINDHLHPNDLLIKIYPSASEISILSYFISFLLLYFYSSSNL